MIETGGQARGHSHRLIEGEENSQKWVSLGPGRPRYPMLVGASGDRPSPREHPAEMPRE